MADTDDSLSGTEYFDLLDGAGSNDTIEGGGSLDILLGGSGNDSISGGDAVGRDRHGRWGRGARSLAAHARRAAVGLASALGVLFVAPLLPGAGGTAHAQATEVSLSVSPDEVGESAGATTLTVVGTLHGGTLAENTEVALTVSAGTAAETDDYTAGTATLTIPVDQTAGTATLTLTPVDDDIDEDDETVTVEGTVTGLTVTPDTVTITDNDSAGVTVSHRALGVYPFARAHYTVVLDSQPSGSVSVSVEGGSSDVRVINSTLTFNERTWSTPQTVSVYAALGTDPERLEFINPPHADPRGHRLRIGDRGGRRHGHGRLGVRRRQARGVGEPVDNRHPRARGRRRGQLHGGARHRAVGHGHGDGARRR